MMFHLKPKQLRQLRTGDLSFDFPKIVLRQNTDAAPKEFVGSGTIVQRERQGFELRMYPKLDFGEALAEFVNSGFQDRPGVLSPPDSYYSLEAFDVEGQVWRSPQVRPNISCGQGGTVFKCKVDQLSTTSPRPAYAKGNRACLYFVDRLSVPWTLATEHTITAGEETLHRSVEFARAEMELDAVKISIGSSPADTEGTFVTAKSLGALPEVLELRILEALRFVTFQNVSWAVAEVSDAKEIRTQVMIRSPGGSGFLPQPVDVPSKANFWALFCVYLRHVLKHTKTDTYHPLTARLMSLLGSGKNVIDTLELALGVAVEDVLNTEYPTLAQPSSVFLVGLEGAKKIVRRVNCENEQIRSRIVGSIDAMKKSRPKDKLKELRTRGRIEEVHVRAWEVLRNTSAHAGSLGGVELQSRVRRCYEVYELLLILIFQAIGYRGPFCRFSKDDWPEDTFEPMDLGDDKT